MTRIKFLEYVMGASSAICTLNLLSMHGFSPMVNATKNKNEHNNSKEFATYGAIHINNTNLVKSTQFWTKIVGMKARHSTENSVEFGTEDKTIVVVHESALKPFQKGYSGLYHFAIHAPNINEFARMIHRLNTYRYPYSPIDHTMSKSIYLEDPDGINIEFTLETPERFKRVITSRGLQIEGTDGVIRSASERLNVNDVLLALEDLSTDRIIAPESYLGHIHLYANNVEYSNSFYHKLGYQQFNFVPQYMYADLGAGGDYQHRIVMNSWHGQNKPLAPHDNAGLRHFHINYHDPLKLKTALASISNYEILDNGYRVHDPSGNAINIKLYS